MIQRILDLCFHRHETKSGDVIWWRDCCLDDCAPDAQGYLWVYPNGETHHCYRTPEEL